MDEILEGKPAPGEWTLRLRLSSHGERERHNDDGHNFGVKIYQLCSVSSSLSHANFEQPIRNLQIKMRGKIFYKEVFLRLPCVRRLFLRLYHRAS